MKGAFKLHRDEQVFVTEIIGQWTEVTARQYARAFCREVNAYEGETFGHLVILQEWELHTPDVTPILQEHVRWSVEHGMRRSAEVFTSDCLKEYSLDKIVEMGKGSLIIHRFDNKEEALIWLSREGFNSQERKLLA